MTISLVLGSFSFAFAHPTTADTFADAMTAGWTYGNSGLSSPYSKDMESSWYQIFGKNSLSMLRDVRYQLTGTDYDNHSGTSLYTYINNIYSTLTNTGSGSILYGINQTNTKLSDIYNSIGVGGSGNNVLSKLSALINAVGDISIPDLTSYVSSIDSGVTNINNDGVKLTGNALNRLNQIAGYTSWISTIRDTTERIESIDTTISAITADTYSKLSSFNDDYNNINWVDSGSFVDVRVNDYNSSAVNPPSTSSNFFVSYNLDGLSSNGIYYIRMPLNIIAASTLNKEFKFDIYISNASRTTLFNANASVIAYNIATNYVDILANIPMKTTTSNYIVVNVKSDSSGYNLYYYAGQNYFVKSVNINDIDYYDVQNYVYNFNFLELLRQAKEMFFDDESLQAKKNNASQTSAVLTGFTGSGQASATVNDYGMLSTGVSDVKGGMTTNVNASSAFGIFNNQSGYSFWSNETLQELNSSGSNTRNLSKSNDDDGYVYYNGRLEYLLNAMNGGDKK